MELGERVRELRLQAGLTKTALAQPEYTVSYVSLIEAGRRKPSAKAIEHLSRRLSVTARFLATGIPEGVEESLRYQTEEARLTLREGRADDAERAIRVVLARSREYGLTELETQAMA